MSHFVQLIFMFLSFLFLVHCEWCQKNIRSCHCQQFFNAKYYVQLEHCSWGDHTLTCIEHSYRVCCEGYYEMNNECIPVCIGGCENGLCEAPNTCSCKYGYHSVNGRCEPQCNHCYYGSCVAPDQCMCMPGFVKNADGQCVRKCKDDCVNGICNDKNQCECRDGFFFNEKLLEFGIKNKTVCSPKCNRRCQNGICVGHNQCKCDSGYTLNNHKCVPICDPQWVNCTNGLCKEPNVCQCNEGYILVYKSCVPECHPACLNGNSIAPGECYCAQDYEKTNKPNI